MIVAKEVYELKIVGIEDYLTDFVNTFNERFELGAIALRPGKF